MTMSAWELGIASVLVLSSAGLSMLLSLGVHRQLLVSAGRMTVQLLIVGFFLKQLFAIDSPWATAGVILVMVLAASREVGSRQERRLKGWWHFGVGGITVSLSTIGITLLALTTTLKPTPWYAAQYSIPLTGFILGTVMNAASLALNSLFGTVARERGAIEARLALGATRYEAFREVTRRAVKAGVLPMMNQMAAAGIITMPGIMTGQLLAGMEPADAARSQILLMFLLAGASFCATTVAVFLAVRRLTDDRDRLRLDRLR